MLRRLALALAVFGVTGLRAQGISAPQPRFFMNMTLTGGGDTLATATYSDGSTSSVKAGGVVQFKAGLDLQLDAHFALQFNLGVHGDSARNAKNGSLSFTRFPFEALAYGYVDSGNRFGLGLRKALNPKLSSSGAMDLGASYEFSSSGGAIFEYEHLFKFGPRVKGGFSLRYVHETYSVSTIDGLPATSDRLDGSHVGVGWSVYF